MWLHNYNFNYHSWLNLCEVELIWHFLKLKSGSNGEFSFANVHILATISVTENISDMCIAMEMHLVMGIFQKEYIWLHEQPTIG
jgi:hypothetical protein